MINGSNPECWVQLFDDHIRRENNTIHFTLNLAARVGTRFNYAYWDYEWKTRIVVNGQADSGYRRIKPVTAVKRNLRNQEHYMSTHSGHFHGSVNVDKNATTIHVQVYFRDSAGNTGGPVNYWVPIPQASAPFGLGSRSLNVEAETATVNAWCNHAGHYGRVTYWELHYGTSSNYGQHIGVNVNNAWAHHFNLTNLKPGVRYYYRARVHTQLGFVSEVKGSFITEDQLIGKRVIQNVAAKGVYAIVIYPDGRRAKVKEIKLVKS